MIPVYNSTGEVIGVQIDSTIYSEAMLLTLIARLQRAEAEKERLTTENARLQAIIDGPRVPRLEPDDYEAIARLSE